MATFARELAERIVAMRYADLPPEALKWGRVSVLDTVGVMLAGAAEDTATLLEAALELKPDAGPCLIVGSRRRATAPDAALINGTAAHALDFDNTVALMGGHISATLVPALIAAGEHCGASGRDLLLAQAAGFETGAALGRVLNPHHTDKGWHPTSTLGVFAVAAACAKLFGLTVEQTETALAIAVSHSAGVKANFGTMTKPLHAGQCARSGLLAALLARKGYTANVESFEHKHGFFQLFNGLGNFDADRAFGDWGRPFDIMTPGAGYKQYPCCYSTHAAIECVLNLAREHGPFDAAAVSRVESWTSTAALAYTDRPDPQSDLDAKFSVQYCVARALVDGKVLLAHFENGAYRDAAVRALLPRVRATPYTPEQFPAKPPFAGEVSVTLADGRVFSSRVDRPLGRAADNAISDADMKTKFEDCAGRVLAPAGVAAAYRAIQELEKLDVIMDLTALLAPAQPAAAVRKSLESTAA